MENCVRLREGNGEESLHSLPEGEHLVGRSRSAQIKISEPDVSGRHLLLRSTPGGVEAENLSSHGTLLNGKVLERRTLLQEGDFLLLGKKTELFFGSAKSGSETLEDSKPSLGGASLSDATAPSQPLPPAFAKSMPRPLQRTAAPSKISEAHARPQQNAFETQMQQTRMASLEEMNYLRFESKRQSRWKFLLYCLAALLLAGAIAALCLFRPPPAESVLSWPCNEKGRPLDQYYDPPNGSYPEGRFALLAPKTSHNSAKAAKDGFSIESRIGRDMDVPLWLILSSSRSDSYLGESRLDTFNAWIKDISKSGGLWNFSPPSALFFEGDGNGLPCLTALYRREADGQAWFGKAFFFRNGDERIVLRAEVPGVQRLRSEPLLTAQTFLEFNPAFVQNHWEGLPEQDQVDGDPEKMLFESEKSINRLAPPTWAQTQTLLFSALIKARKSKDAAIEDRALKLLIKLRAQQEKWFNSQRLAYMSEKANENKMGALRIKESCEAVFCLPDDRRYQIVRNGRL